MADNGKSSFCINCFQIFAFVLSFANSGEGFKCLYCLLEFQTIGWGGEIKHQTFLQSKNPKKLDHKSDRQQI